MTRSTTKPRKRTRRSIRPPDRIKTRSKETFRGRRPTGGFEWRRRNPGYQRISSGFRASTPSVATRPVRRIEQLGGRRPGNSRVPSTPFHGQNTGYHHRQVSDRERARREKARPAYRVSGARSGHRGGPLWLCTVSADNRQGFRGLNDPAERDDDIDLLLRKSQREYHPDWGRIHGHTASGAGHIQSLRNDRL